MIVPSSTGMAFGLASAIVVGIDATRNRSGGAVAHLRGILGAIDPVPCGISQVHLWSYDELLQTIKSQPWLIKHPVAASHGSILQQLTWQYFRLPTIAKQLGVEVMFNTSAGSVCPFQPSVTLSQDMLSFESGEMQRFPWFSRDRLRLEVLKQVQLHRLQKSSRVLFLTEYARQVIGQFGSLPKSVVVPHGINQCFFDVSVDRRSWPMTGPIHCLYVSNAALYKHQWHVVAAISQLRSKTGLDLRLRLVGGGEGSAMERLTLAVNEHDPEGNFVEIEQFIPNIAIAKELTQADLFIYASSCENLPVTLLEAMAAGLPIASSNRGPMPEVLGDAATFFDPESPIAIASAVISIINDQVLRERIRMDAQHRARAFTWERCAKLTWQVLFDTAINTANSNNPSHH